MTRINRSTYADCPCFPSIDRSHWERPSSAPSITSEEISRCLHHVDDQATFVTYTRLPDGLANGTWKVEWKSAQTKRQGVLRVSARDSEAFLREGKLLDWLNGQANAPVNYFHSDSVVLNTPWELLEWMEGEPLSVWLAKAHDPITLAPSVVANCLSRIRLKDNCPIDLPYYSTASLPDGIRDSLNNPLVATRIEEIERDNGLKTTVVSSFKHVVDTYNDVLANQLENYRQFEGIIHCDFGGSNLLVTEQNKSAELSAVVDWEFAAFGSIFIDLGNLLRARTLYQPDFEQAICREFARQGHPLPEGWEKMALLSDSLNWLYFLSRPMHRPNLFADCYRRLGFIIEQLKADI